MHEQDTTMVRDREEHIQSIAGTNALLGGHDARYNVPEVQITKNVEAIKKKHHFTGSLTLTVEIEKQVNYNV